jgi:hypothetical protein
MTRQWPTRYRAVDRRRHTAATIAQNQLLANDTDVDGDNLKWPACRARAARGEFAAAATSCSPDGQLQRPGQLHLHHHRRQGRQRDGHRQPGGQPVNDAPVANADIASTPIVAIGSIAVLANDTDGEGNPERDGSQRQSQKARSASTPTAPGFTPALNVSGPVVISYSISDGAGGTTTNSVTVNIG